MGCAAERRTGAWMRRTAARAWSWCGGITGTSGRRWRASIWKEHGLVLSRETLRQLLIGAGLGKAKPRKLKRCTCGGRGGVAAGELLQWDTSVHAWLEERGPAKMYLIAGIDDATNRLFARFVPADSTEHHMRVLWAYVERYGRPQAVYTDRASLFQPTLAPGWREAEPGPKTETQMGRAFRELGIEWIAAHSPQAKGRVERCFGTLQNRLVKALRWPDQHPGGSQPVSGREYFCRNGTSASRVPAASALDAHRPLGEVLRLASIAGWVENAAGGQRLHGAVERTASGRFRKRPWGRDYGGSTIRIEAAPGRQA